MKAKCSRIALTVTIVAASMVHAKSAADADVCFLAVPFAQGGAVSLQLENRSNKQDRVTIHRYSQAGQSLESIEREVGPREKTTLRIDVSSDRPEFGWLRATSRDVAVGATYEYLNGNTLTTVPVLAVFPHPTFKGAIQSARRYSLHHRYTYDVFSLRGSLYFFVNLSNYPVRVGVCQDDYPDCTVMDMPYSVAPLASAYFPIDQQKRFLVLHSDPGLSAATAMEATEGLKRIFSTSTSITFGPPEK